MRKKFFYAPKQRTIFIASIFMKPVIIKVLLFGHPCDERFPPRTENIQNVDKISFTSLTNAWFSLHGFSRNSQLSGSLKKKKITVGHFCHVQDISQLRF